MKSAALPIVTGSFFAAFLLIIGVLNLVLVHSVPGVAYLLLALLYLPGTNLFLARRFGFSVPAFVKIGLAVVVFFFTFGVSDLGDIIDKWLA